MLLTKPLQTFLNANRTPYLDTLLLVTPTGKLLSSSSSLPASVLRAQATHACSIWALYKPIVKAGVISSALPNPEEEHEDSDNEDDSPDRSGAQGARSRVEEEDLSSITVQLDKGVMIVQPLKCSLLFVAIGPSAAAIQNSASSTSLQGLRHEMSHLSVASAVGGGSPPASSHSEMGKQASHPNLAGLRSSGASTAGSSIRGGREGRALRMAKRQAEELGKWLDGELEGFQLPTVL
jgi:hypothetical protein